MTEFFLDNSSLESLVCTRRYVLHVVFGLKRPPEPSLRYGKLFHLYMKYIDESDLAIFMAPPLPSADKWNTPELLEARAQIPDTIQMQLAIHACAIRDRLGAQLSQGVREGFYQFPHPRIPGAIVCGTIDLRSERQPWVLLTDYKSTGKPITGDLLQSYQLKSQMFFYASTKRMHARIKAGNKEPLSPVDIAYLEGNVQRQYIIASYKSNDAHAVNIGEIEPIHQDVLDEYDALIEEKASLARYLHDNPEKSTRDGMTNDGCRFCPYKSICSLNNPQKEQHAIKQWAYGYGKYDPSAF